jgi:hypothetical protein
MNSKSRTDRKEVGNWGELLVERYMEENGWQCLVRNQRIPGGEIDRAFVRTPKESMGRVHFCMAEVKVAKLGKMNWAEFLSECNIRRFVKRRQMLSLFNFGHHLLSLQGALESCLHIRLFLVVKISESGGAHRALHSLGWAKVCQIENGVVLLALAPEFIASGGNASGLQIEVSSQK